MSSFSFILLFVAVLLQLYLSVTQQLESSESPSIDCPQQLESNDEHSNWKLHVVAPQQDVLFAGHLYFKIHVEKQHRKCYLPISIGSNSSDPRCQQPWDCVLHIIEHKVDFPLIITINGVSSYQGHLRSALFDGVLLPELFKAHAENVITFTVQADGQQTLTASLRAHWDPQPTTSPMFEAIVNFIRPESTRLKSLLIAGFSHCALTQFVAADPGRLEIFIPDLHDSLSPCGESQSKWRWTSARIFHDWGSKPSQLRNIAYVDNSLLSIDGVAALVGCSMIPTGVDTPGSSCINEVYDFAREVILRSRASVWLLASAPWRVGMQRILFRLSQEIAVFTKARFMQRSPDPSRPDTEASLDEDLDVWVHVMNSDDRKYTIDVRSRDRRLLSQRESSNHLLYQSLLNHSAVDSSLLNIMFSPSSSNTATTTTNDHVPLRTSKILSENYEVGKSHVLFENVCLVRKVNSAEESNQGYTDYSIAFFQDERISFSSTRSLSKYFRDIELYTGFDKGFALSGLLMQDINVSGASGIKLQSELPWLSGLSVLSVPPAYNHLTHTLEPLLKLIYIAHLQFKYKYKGKKAKALNAGPAVDPLALFAIHDVKRLLLGKFTPSSAGDWLHSMIGLVMGYYQSTLAIDGIAAPAVYTMDMLIDIDPSVPNAREVMCFDQLALFGYTNTHVMYFEGEEYGSRFKQYIYSAMNVPQHITNLRNSSSLLPRQRKLKVTIVLRNGSRRRLVNAIQLQRLLLEATAEYAGEVYRFVDEQWLLHHLVVLETLSFREQVLLFAETDLVVTIHGAAIVNAIFMQPGSVLIDIFNANYYEFFFSSIIRESGVKALYLPITDHAQQTSDCDPRTPAWCATADDNQSLDCVQIRQCSVEVDLVRFQPLLMEAYNHVLSMKWFP